ncbi:MAG: hypothetical protein COC06_10360 [Bacteroidales bacterium]|nr:S24 family peptidase [Labilibaculum sp.]PCH67945.1 MAG: hypothetical protein COC06_10360 [Bacteroidales bacterium]
MQDISLFKKNILKFLELQGIRKSEFYRITGITRGVLDHSSGLSEDNVTKFIASYPKINLEWLLTGKGEMISEQTKTILKCSTTEELGILIPLYNSEASAGIGELQLSNEHIIDKLQVPFARKDDIALTIVGDSMTPAMQSGDIAVVRNMPNWRDYLDFGNIFIVVTESEVYCKIVSKSSEQDIFKLKSYNSKYDEFEIPKKFISQIYKVIGIISQRSY